MVLRKAAASSTAVEYRDPAREETDSIQEITITEDVEQYPTSVSILAMDTQSEVDWQFTRP
eukprot:4360643-Prorocentrum_lima.AAC.1